MKNARKQKRLLEGEAYRPYWIWYRKGQFMKRKIVLCLFLVVLPLALGCNKDNRKMAEVTGMVKLDGEPLHRGSIQFIPTAGGFDGGGAIVHGKFTATVPYGECKVNIAGEMFEHVGEDGSPTNTFIATEGMEAGQIKEPPPKQRVPERYWGDTPLRATVIKSKGETFDFQLEIK
ncbi:MAG: hypothetical protein LBJ00_09950 [Planctomycetaceae bacterium]|nr:hypothetical protein [Planctomycetaceae bacterium]